MRRVKKFYEDEAEVGSDDEEHDDVRKDINRDDEEEDEEGLDEDLGGFVVHGDEEEIGGVPEGAMEKFKLDMELLDRQDIQRTAAAIILGVNNKKRKRNDVEGLIDDENGRRKQRMIEERLKEMKDRGDGDVQDLLQAAVEV